MKPILIFSFCLICLFSANSVLAYYCQTGGWAWSDTIGWTSFSCEADLLNSAANATCDAGNWPRYGVKVQDSGYFTDYAWNDNVGWINFGPNSPDDISPDGTVNPAKLHIPDPANPSPLDNQVTGWARINTLSQASGGGWISMNCQTDPSIADKSRCDSSGPGGFAGYKVYYDKCQFHGWAYSDDVGWICFNCANEQKTTSCSGYPGYFVTCGEPPQEFTLTASRDSENPCSIIDLQWDKPGTGTYNYKIFRNGSLLVDSSNPEDNFNPDCAGGTCVYHDGVLGYGRPENFPQPETSYSYQVEAISGCGSRYSNITATTTTICPSVLSINSNPLAPDYCCKSSISQVRLSWTFAKGAGGNENSGQQYVLYQAIGGAEIGGGVGVFEKAVTSVSCDKDGVCSWGFDRIASSTPSRFCSSCSSNYCWCSPPDKGTAPEQDFVFTPNQHYYYFVRAINPNQNVDSNVVDVCCLSQ